MNKLYFWDQNRPAQILNVLHKCTLMQDRVFRLGTKQYPKQDNLGKVL